MSDPITTAQQLTASLDAMSTQLEAVSAAQDEQIKYGRRNRHLIRGLVVSLLISVLLTVALVFVAVKTNEANSKATETHNQQVATCVSTNEARRLNTQLWAYIFALKPSTPRTAAQQQQVMALQ